jgi:hypothetical protein
MYDLKILEFDTQIDLELPLIIVKKKKNLSLKTINQHHYTQLLDRETDLIFYFDKSLVKGKFTTTKQWV